MFDSFQVAGEIYLLGFVIAMVMAAIIKVMLFIINKTEGRSKK
jgi:hypothetical protein